MRFELFEWIAYTSLIYIVLMTLINIGIGYPFLEIQSSIQIVHDTSLILFGSLITYLVYTK